MVLSERYRELAMAAKLVNTSNLSTPSDTYLYSLAQAGSTHATIGSDDSLRFFNVPDLKVVQSIAPAHQGIACLVSGSDDRTFLTAGRDARIRVWDPRNTASTTKLELTEPKGAGFSAIACAGNFVAAGTESTKEGLGDVSVLVYDLRNPKSPIRSYVESHTDTITALAWHPKQRNLLLSGSTDGLVSIFDAEVAEEEDALMQVLNPRSAVHCAGFLPDDQVYSLSTDEQFSIYGLDKSGTAEEEALPMKEFGDVREQLSCSYVVDIVQQPFLRSPVMAYGNNEKQTLELMTLQPQPEWSFGSRMQLPGAHGEEVVRGVQFVDESSVLTCGEDGQVKLWSLGESGTTANEEAEMDVDAGAGSKKAKRKGKKSERFAPY